MTRDDTEIVSAVQSALTDKVGTTRFGMWFDSQVQWSLSGDHLQLEVRDTFTLERIRRSFQSDLEKALEAVLRQPGRISFRVVTREAQSLTPQQLVEAGPRRDTTLKPSTDHATPKHGRWGTFKSLVVGDANRIAVTAAEMLKDQPGTISPFFIHGTPGSGKTHLLQSIWTEFRQRRHRCRAIYMTAEQFTCQFLAALRGSGLPSFRHKYRDVELLLIDDIQFFVGKRATISELHYTIDTLLREGRQMVFASQNPPAELQDLGMDLIARISGGLVCGIGQADLEMRRSICEQYCQAQQVKIEPAVIDYLVHHLRGDTRLLHGAINRLRAMELAFGVVASVEMARDQLQDLFQVARRSVKLPDIERAICDVFGLSARSLQSTGRTRSVSQPRMLAMWLAREYTRAAFAEIGDFFGHRAHNTVISAHQRVNRWMAENETIQTPHGCWNARDAIRRVEAELQLA